MVYFDVLSRKKCHRVYPVLPVRDRLLHWLKRVDANTRRFPRPRMLLLPLKLMEALGLSDQCVLLDAAGQLWQDSYLIASVTE